MNIPGMIRLVTLSVRRGAKTFRYKLFDSSGSEVNDRNNNHIIRRDNVSEEWVRVEGTNDLKYDGEELRFGPASSDWGTVEHIQIEVDTTSGFQSFGALELETKPTVSEGEWVSLNPKKVLTIDYSGGSDSLSDFPSINNGFMSLLEGPANNRIPQWRFQLIPDSTDYTSSSVVGGDEVEWSHENDKLVYKGDTIIFRKNDVGSFNVKEYAVYAIVEGREFQFGRSSDGTSVSQGDTPKLESGNLSLQV